MKIQNMLVAAAALGMCLTGCASTEEAAAGQAASRFYAALTSQNGEQACALLAPKAAESLQSGGQTCATAIGDLKLPGGQAVQVEVWGDEAQVRLARDTVFLHRFPAGWLVRGVGCEPRKNLPYDCEVST
jgi:hypothetical protein